MLPHFGNLRFHKPFPGRKDTLDAIVKTTRRSNSQVSTAKSNHNCQETPHHQVHATSQVDCTQACTRVPEGLRFNELLSSRGLMGRLDCLAPGSIRGYFQCQPLATIYGCTHYKMETQLGTAVFFHTVSLMATMDL